VPISVLGRRTTAIARRIVCGFCGLTAACGAFSLAGVEPDASIDGGGGDVMSTTDADDAATPECDSGDSPCPCVKTLLSPGGGPVVAFQIDATYAYWLGKIKGESVPNLYRAPLTGNGPTTTLNLSGTISGAHNNLGLDSQYVYLSESTGTPVNLARIPLDGGNVTAFSPSLPMSPTDLQAGPRGLYWTDNESDLCTAAFDGTLPPGDSGCGGAPLLSGSVTNSYQDSLTIADASVYLSIYSAGLWRVSTTTGQATLLTVASDPSYASRPMAATDTDLYFAQGLGEAGSVAHVAAAGGSASVLTTVNKILALALDDTYVYFIENTSPMAQIAKVPRDGSALPTVLGCDGSNPGFLAVDGESVYWANESNGQVWKAPK
jgi:hypothetical protein